MEIAKPRIFMCSRNIMETRPAHVRPLRRDDYEVVCQPKMDIQGRYVGFLRVTRKTDGKVIYPFDGCVLPGPFLTASEAREVAHALGEEFVRLDISHPEDPT